MLSDKAAICSALVPPFAMETNVFSGLVSVASCIHSKTTAEGTLGTALVEAHHYTFNV